MGTCKTYPLTSSIIGHSMKTRRVYLIDYRGKPYHANAGQPAFQKPGKLILRNNLSPKSVHGRSATRKEES
ncbi:MAG: hypothetical protein A2V62_12895 [Nitrospirae bacterium RBG_19FT_COMBO_58_9]|nr:MAG: hypothetical protein A2V62_12895 [Nitrospirae bacterium RBG_19FT_COMBO_58_9]